MALRRDASERLFQDDVVRIAKMNGWQIMHVVPHQVRPGVWRSDAPGFPDLVLAHHKRGIIFAELKTERGKMSDEQKQWAVALAPHGEYYLWRPNQLELIATRLGGTTIPDGLK